MYPPWLVGLCVPFLPLLVAWYLNSFMALEYADDDDDDEVGVDGLP